MTTACWFCGEALDAGAERCRHCGELLVEGARPAGAAAPRGRDPWDPGELLRWTFDDPEWVKKIALGALCLLGSCLVAPMWLFMGYRLRIAREQRARPGAPMPDWSDPGELLAEGLRLWLAMLLLVGLLLAGFGAIVGVGLAVDLLTTGRPGPGLALAGVAAYGLILFGSLALQYVLPAIELEFLETGSILSAVRFGSLWRHVSTDATDYLVLFIYVFALGMLASFGVVACYVGMFFTIPWAQFTGACAVGRFAARRDARARA